MAAWVNTSIDFGMPYVWLTVTSRQLATTWRVLDEVLQKIRLHMDEPERIEATVTDLIEAHRPELAGGSLLAIHHLGFEMKLLYTHPSLPRVELGNMCDEMPLIPDPAESPAPAVVTKQG